MNGVVSALSVVLPYIFLASLLLTMLIICAALIILTLREYARRQSLINLMGRHLKRIEEQIWFDNHKPRNIQTIVPYDDTELEEILKRYSIRGFYLAIKYADGSMVFERDGEQPVRITMPMH